MLTVSQGGAYVHNLIAGGMDQHHFDPRQTPFHKAHSTELAGFHDNPSGDDRYFNNLVMNRGDLSKYDAARLPVRMEGNVFLHGARPSKHEQSPLCETNWEPAFKLTERPDGLYLELALNPTWKQNQARKLVTTESLSKAAIPNLPYENPDGTPVRIDTDYFGNKRDQNNPFPGPLELSQDGQQLFKVWPPRSADR